MTHTPRPIADLVAAGEVTVTHLATCADDGLVIPLSFHGDEPEICGVCEEPKGIYLVIADGGPGSICQDCTGDLNWTVVPV